MTRYGYPRRLFTVLLVLLTITPQNLLHPCCCSRNQAMAGNTRTAGVTDADVLDSEDPSLAGLSPCCRERLQVAQRAALHKTLSNPADSNRCRSEAVAFELGGTSRAVESQSCSCRSASETPRVERLVFRQSDLKVLAILDLVDLDSTDSPCVFATRLSFNISPTELRLRPDCAHLCRWTV
jgi:hypothetical protein